MPILIVILGIPLSIFNGWGLCKLWQWFIMPVFEVKSLSIPIAIGISYIIVYLTYVPDFNAYKNSTDLDESLKRVAFNLTYTFMKVCIFVSFGWIVSKFI